MGTMPSWFGGSEQEWAAMDAFERVDMERAYALACGPTAEQQQAARDLRKKMSDSFFSRLAAR